MNSMTKPEGKLSQGVWKIKQAFALDADAQSRKLLAAAQDAQDTEQKVPSAVDVFNTCSWPRTDLVVLGKELSAAGDVVTGPDGEPAASQRLSTGELAFLAKDVPALAGKRYTIGAGRAATDGKAKAAATTVENSTVSAQVDPASGAIAHLRANGHQRRTERPDTRAWD